MRCRPKDRRSQPDHSPQTDTYPSRCGRRPHVRCSAGVVHLTGRNARATLGITRCYAAARPRPSTQPIFRSCFNCRYHNTPIIDPPCIASQLKFLAATRRVRFDRFPLRASVTSHRFLPSRASLGANPFRSLGNADSFIRNRVCNQLFTLFFNFAILSDRKHTSSHPSVPSPLLRIFPAER